MFFFLCLQGSVLRPFSGTLVLIAHADGPVFCQPVDLFRGEESVGADCFIFVSSLLLRLMA